MLHCEPLTDQDREVLDREDAGQRREDKREGRSFLATLSLFESLEDFFRPVGSCMLLLQCTVLCFLHRV